jgi:prepilin-type N-terminal cleavage/methylation domain-containing protein
MKPSKIPSAFTLVEVIVSMTILGIIMVSVMVVFISGSNTANKIDIQRGLQENVKNIVETIAEDIRKNGINMCSP